MPKTNKKYRRNKKVFVPLWGNKRSIKQTAERKRWRGSVFVPLRGNKRFNPVLRQKIIFSCEFTQNLNLEHFFLYGIPLSPFFCAATHMTRSNRSHHYCIMEPRRLQYCKPPSRKSASDTACISAYGEIPPSVCPGGACADSARKKEESHQ